jgi:hypothetical protein
VKKTPLSNLMLPRIHFKPQNTAVLAAKVNGRVVDVIDNDKEDEEIPEEIWGDLTGE